jgi:glyceraldehyde-3-phosphate dehydrogenase/erythrose-4-phosphate dehydrogenase
MNSMNKVLIVGYGSIGKRHLENLLIQKIWKS